MGGFEIGAGSGRKISILSDETDNPSFAAMRSGSRDDSATSSNPSLSSHSQYPPSEPSSTRGDPAVASSSNSSGPVTPDLTQTRPTPAQVGVDSLARYFDHYSSHHSNMMPHHPLVRRDSASFGAPNSHVPEEAVDLRQPLFDAKPEYPPVPDLLQPAFPLQNTYHASAAAAQPTEAQADRPRNKATKKGNRYPCPHAQRSGCTDTFTTSGHAARHGKKHTGEKNVFCPVCNKAFTRKDNMKQHERTHKSRNTVSNHNQTDVSGITNGMNGTNGINDTNGTNGGHDSRNESFSGQSYHSQDMGESRTFVDPASFEYPSPTAFPSPNWSVPSYKTQSYGQGLMIDTQRQPTPGHNYHLQSPLDTLAAVANVANASAYARNGYK